VIDKASIVPGRTDERQSGLEVERLQFCRDLIQPRQEIGVTLGFLRSGVASKKHYHGGNDTEGTELYMHGSTATKIL